ncbi:hypothetical protein AYR62_01580 [Secundilactobacillus paracollinoides]|uniref:acylphosphatase n=1 Tax=Secundilactobacillus paracollinoides TaxID=240427 RepID=A0A1B2IV65_9LACO|nr:acylphosphatase [Secundilactobacillus paracollinoides]ANZ60124.1 hypothetical protein AYR61_01345 [Secundilactobacillus paracollinoides]ANZ62922.1 hypothetical protein AYR62_01580 [Secundilactobacillus paracollinoides]ANZ65918.1 hypothetical protein AYR63_01365 [Secundilactobacillus paracollinoides]
MTTNRTVVALLHKLRKLRDWYVITQANGVTLPETTTEPITRVHYVFHGKVQKVGFRLLLKTIADRMHLTGWVMNNDNLDVVAEVQGTPTQLAFIKHYLSTGVKRIQVAQIEERQADIALNEHQFIIK